MADMARNHQSPLPLLLLLLSASASSFLSSSFAALPHLLQHRLHRLRACRRAGPDSAARRRVDDDKRDDPRFHLLSPRSTEPDLIPEKADEDEEHDEDDDPVKSLFAWVTRAVSGDDCDARYDDLELAFAASFLRPPPDSDAARLVREALAALPPNDHEPCGAVHSAEERERNSLGALGAAQWEGQAGAETFPHSVLRVRNLTGVEEWERSIPRTCRQNLRRAERTVEDQRWRVEVRPIRGDEAAPHSSLAHFRCVVEHELRLRLGRRRDGGRSEGDDDVEGTIATVEEWANELLDLLCEAVGRFVATTRMAGTIREYRSGGSGDDDVEGGDDGDGGGRVVAFLHEVRKGRTIRGQWFYATDEAARNYVWFHCVRDMVRRAVEEDGVDTVDLGPNGSDGRSDHHGHAELKRRYGFESVEDWPEVADYLGPFW